MNEEEIKSKSRDINNISFERKIESNENKTKEEMTLIFYDKNLSKDENKTKIIELFQQINDYVLICSDRQTLFTSIDKIQTEKVFLILSGSSIKDVLDSIHDYRQIDSIFIFCINKEKYLNYLNNDKYYIDISKSTTILADVKQFSDFPEEEEILFDLGESFIINSIDYDQKQNLWIVKLTSVSEESFIQYINKFITENCSTTNMNILLGELFFIMEQYSTCRNYFLNIVNTFKQDD